MVIHVGDCHCWVMWLGSFSPAVSSYGKDVQLDWQATGNAHGRSGQRAPMSGRHHWVRKPFPAFPQSTSETGVSGCALHKWNVHIRSFFWPVWRPHVQSLNSTTINNCYFLNHFTLSSSGLSIFSGATSITLLLSFLPGTVLWALCII